MDSTSEAAPRARWTPCTRACYRTLHWPVAQPSRDRSVRATHAARAVCPPLPAPPHRLLAICEEAGLRELVRQHMRRLRTTPLFVHAGDCFDCVTERVADYVVEACGGPLYYSQRHAHLQAGAGLPLLLDEDGRELWLVQLWHAFDDVNFPPALRADFWGWAEPLSVHLLAPRARHDGLTRYAYDTVRSWFATSTSQACPPDDGAR
ncbi:oxygen-binding protein [Paraburkholderia caballeronis]|uniref:oxygen-binding protein n=1 Tax=Paraburkholderia caballeronis TaxID=416943 RepID=UPI0010EA09EA|nr:oxygen-binding protein [Paraburkholderia caballeronis]TDV15727.1 truncated hemoglobin YjbI [Paraburkholderia caballeronis]TDV17982.1 truncated hemoglobin YjbI [Paraburkholderia caballeronis]TDV26404.1 truncated hemoglobin YjbI [Paraburkholderia caballeronis]